jgi:hypothetical protein
MISPPRLISSLDRCQGCGARHPDDCTCTRCEVCGALLDEDGACVEDGGGYLQDGDCPACAYRPEEEE